MQIDRTDAPAAVEYVTVHVVFELSKSLWLLGVKLPGRDRPGRYRIEAGNTQALERLLTEVRAKASRLGRPVRIASCYEAGFDGHWLHRWLVDRGIESHEVDASSIGVNRRARRAKTDRIDLDMLMRAFTGRLQGDASACALVRVPTPEEEDRKRRTRERERLIAERTMHSNRIGGLLHCQGIRELNPFRPGFLSTLETVRTGDGRPLLQHIKAEIRREHARLMLVHDQIKAMDTEDVMVHRAAEAGSPAAKVVLLTQLKGVGLKLGQVLCNEVYYRRFDNRRQLGSFLGLTDTPYDSGASRRQQGISKAGNHRGRTSAIELAWLWLRHQPDSALSQWFREKAGNQKGRIRKIAIVAMARKLMIALWRYLENGVVPTGAVMHPSI